MKVLRVLVINLTLSVLVIAAAALVLAADAWWPFRLPDQFVLLAWPFLVIGTLLITFALVTFLRFAHALGAVGDAPGRLVTAGPFGYLRNPIYVGVGLLLYSVAFYRQSPTFLLAAIIFLPAIDTFVRRVEEPRLEARFGKQYVEYKRAVPRWIPRIRGRNLAPG